MSTGNLHQRSGATVCPSLPWTIHATPGLDEFRTIADCSSQLVRSQQLNQACGIVCLDRVHFKFDGSEDTGFRIEDARIVDPDLSTCFMGCFRLLNGPFQDVAIQSFRLQVGDQLINLLSTPRMWRHNPDGGVQRFVLAEFLDRTIDNDLFKHFVFFDSS